MYIGIAVTILVDLIPALADLEDSLTEILTLLVAYILGTGLADFGKNRPTVIYPKRSE
jgi:hypothetical protein